MSPRSALLGAVLLAAPAAAKPLIVDTFDEGKPANVLRLPTGAWGDPGDKSVGCVTSFDAAVKRGGTGRSLRLDYDVDSERQNVHIPTNLSIANPAQVRQDSYNGYYTLLGDADLRPHKFLVFWVKGDPAGGFTRSFKLELKDDLGAAGTQVEGITAEWQRFDVPLQRFKEIRHWDKVRELTFVFGPPLVTRKTGSLNVDDVYFTDNPNERLRVERRRREAGRPGTPPGIDGALTEWPEADYADISDPHDYLELGKPSSPTDLGAWFAAAWDDQALYLAVDVRDDAVANAQPPHEIWKDDCVEVYLTPDDRDLAWGDKTQFQLGFAPNSSTGEPARWAWFQNRAPSDEEIRSAVKRYKDGYQMEIAIAWTFLGVAPAPGKTVGFTLAVHDRDRRDAKKESKLNWSFEPLGGPTYRLGTLVLK